MTLKDWNKTYQDNSVIIWFNRKRNEDVWVGRIGNRFEVHNCLLYYQIKKNSFKTKSQALKFAKAYMRKH